MAKKIRKIPNEYKLEVIHKVLAEIIDEHGFFQFEGSCFSSELPYSTDLIGSNGKKEYFCITIELNADFECSIWISERTGCKEWLMSKLGKLTQYIIKEEE